MSVSAFEVFAVLYQTQTLLICVRLRFIRLFTKFSEVLTLALLPFISSIASDEFFILISLVFAKSAHLILHFSMMLYCQMVFLPQFGHYHQSKLPLTSTLLLLVFKER